MYCVTVMEPSDDRQTYSGPDVHGPFTDKEKAEAYRDKLRADFAKQGQRLEVTVEPLLAPEA